MISANNLRPGVVFLLDGELYSCVEYSYVKPGKGGAFARTKIRRLSDGSIISRTFRSEEKIEDVRIEQKVMQYLYKDGNLLYFMDNDTYEQIPINIEQLGDAINFIIEGSNIEVNFYEDKVVGVEIPPAVELEVAVAAPGVKGDTATGASKLVKLVTGYTVQVPLFIEQGDIIKVDTRTGEYLERM